MKRAKRYVGIMVSNQRQKKRVLRTYHRVTPEDIEIFTFTPKSINWITRKVNGLHYVNGKLQTKWFSFPSIVYNRCYGAKRQLVRRIEKIIGKNRCFNHINHFDKQFTYDVLCNTELAGNLPITVPYNQANLDDLLERYRTVYLKPALGNSGRGVHRVVKSETGEVHISEHYFAPSVTCPNPLSIQRHVEKLTRSKEYVVQQGISFMQIEDKNFDIRVLVQKNETGSWNVINIVSRTAYSSCFNTSVCENVAPTKEVLESLMPAAHAEFFLKALSRISLNAAASLEERGKCHLGEISVDFGLDNEGKLWIVEINGNPQRTLYEDLIDYEDVYRNPIRYAKYLLSNQ